MDVPSQKSIEERVKSAEFELKTTTTKGHTDIQKLYDPKEVINTNFVADVMKAMKLRNVNSVILVCRSGPRSKAAANLLAKEGIKAYNLEDGFYVWMEGGKNALRRVLNYPFTNQFYPHFQMVGIRKLVK